jgi:hypothetical protein
MDLSLLSCYLLLVLSKCAVGILEYVAMGPNSDKGSTTLQWVAVEYDEGVSSASDVSLSLVGSAVTDLGAWYGLDTGTLALTAKIVGDNMYALYSQDEYTASGGGCCADTLRIYSRTGGGQFTSMNLTSVVQTGLNNTDAYVSHTFDVAMLQDGTLAALFQVKYLESAIGNAYADAIVGMNILDGSLLKTASGASAFNMYEVAGTTSRRSKDSRFKIQYYSDSNTKTGEEFHGNGVQRFTSTDGTAYLAFTHRTDAEAVIFKDPFTYSIGNGGGLIVQRFGTPSLYSSSGATRETRYFGLQSSASAFASGVHNVFYTASSYSSSLKGKETIALFVNKQDDKSAVYEFVFNPVEEGSTADSGDDTVFDVDYVFAKCTFTAPAQGGTRTIGDGVFLVASGGDTTGTGFEIVDSSGSSKNQSYTLGGVPSLYDPFIRVLATTYV